MPFINDEPVLNGDEPINLHIESRVVDTALPVYPVPSLAKVKSEVARILATFTDDKSQNEFQQALTALEPHLSHAFEACVNGLRAESGPKGGNWATKRFKELLLSLPAPLSTSSSSFAFALEKPADSHVESAIVLLRGLADVYTSRSTLDVIGSDGAGKRFETKQLSELLATVRRPGLDSDSIESFSGSRHVVVWKGGRAYRVDILDSKGSPISIARIRAQIEAVFDASASSLSQHTSFASLSTMLDRRQWASEYAKLKPDNLEAIETLESSIVTMTFHDNATENTQDRLRASREDRSIYSDKTLGFSIFPDGAAGGRADHTVADGGVMVRFLAVLHSAMKKVSLEEAEEESWNEQSCHVTELRCNCAASESATVDRNPYTPTPKRTTFDIPQPADILDLLRSTSVLGFTIQIAFQAALFTLEQSPPGLMVEPISLRAFKEGRCDPSYLISEETVALIQAAAAGESEDKLLAAFIGAMMAYRQQAKDTRGGAGVGPGIMMLRKSVEMLPDSEQRSIVLQQLQLFQRPSVYFSGVPSAGFVDAAEANVFAQDQLAMSYIGKEDRITACVAATGKFADKLTMLPGLFSKYLLTFGTLATAYAGVEQMYPGRSLQVLASFARQQHTGAPSKGTIAIHAGAGEEFGLQPHETKLVEFLMSVVAHVGATELANEHAKAVDVAQRAVVALENCVFFNAGKGSVFNEQGEHELEACIVDGDSGASGAVAGTKTLQNPILAAAMVKDRTEHVLIAGDAADVFGREMGLKQVPNAHFDSAMRRAQLQQAKAISSPCAMHPQTVGAVVLDARGHLAAATSTGGVVKKKAGRIGDTAIIGAGCFADARIAVACSGQGDAFLRRSVAAKIAFHPDAMQSILDELQQKDRALGAVLTVNNDGAVQIAQTARSFFCAISEKGSSAIISKVIVKDRTPKELPPFFQDDNVVAALSPTPTTSGETIIRLKADASLNELPKAEFARVLLSVKQIAVLIKAATDVRRVALVTTADREIRLIPMHGLSEDWKPVLGAELEYNEKYPGYITSKAGPEMPKEKLDKTRDAITSSAKPAMNLTYLGGEDEGKDNIFAKIVRGEVPQWRLWESASHIAFLTPWGNAPGFTVLVPRKHQSSDVLSLADTDLFDLAGAVWEASQQIRQSVLGASRVGLIFEGMEIDYAHAKLIPIQDGSNTDSQHLREPFRDTYAGFVSSKHGPVPPYEQLEEMNLKLISATNTIRTIVPTKTLDQPATHFLQALKSPWYRGVFQILDTLFHGTVKYFNNELAYKYAITPVTTDCISSPMGLGSDSQPVSINLFGQDTYLADSMQFTLEYLLRFDDRTQGMYYISPSFRGEDPDSTHLNQFFHVECEMQGTMETAISTAENYIVSLTRTYYAEHKDIIHRIAGTTAHMEALLDNYDPAKGFPRVPLDDAIAMMPGADCWELAVENSPNHGRKLTRRGERHLIAQYGGFVWLTEMDHLSVPFYQAYVPGTDKLKARAGDLLMGLGETLGMGERHATAAEAADALDHHEVPRESYDWYLDIREAQSMQTSGWGMGSERYLCWLLQHDDVRDLALIPRLKGDKFLP